MQIVDPEKLRLVPGESIHAMFGSGPDNHVEIGLFVRGVTEQDSFAGTPEIKQRAGLIRFNDVLLVVTMIKVKGFEEELFDIWWNYHAPDGIRYFDQMGTQERLTVHFYNERGKKFSVDTQNGFKKFFSDLHPVFAKTDPWTEVEFDRAVRGFCARSYPKENLWQMIEVGVQPARAPEPPAKTGGVEDYPGQIPAELGRFYTYVPDLGHCIRVIPSMLEPQAVEGNPEDFLHPAPVKTVLRCGIRWTNGFPVAPIPFIPGHGLAVPPEDTEM